MLAFRHTYLKESSNVATIRIEEYFILKNL